MGGCFSQAHGGQSGAVVHAAYLQPPPSVSDAPAPKASASEPRESLGPQNGDHGALPTKLTSNHPSAVPSCDPSSPKNTTAASSSAARDVFTDLKPTTPPSAAMPNGYGQQEYKGKRKKLPASVDTSTSDTPCGRSPGITPSARTPKVTNTHSANSYTVDDFWAPSSPHVDQQRKISDPLIRVLSPMEIARGDGVVRVDPMFLDDDGDEADDFLLCDPG